MLKSEIIRALSPDIKYQNHFEEEEKPNQSVYQNGWEEITQNNNK